MNPLARWFERRRLDRELCEEMAAHIEERAEQLREDGMDEEQARFQAHRQFGNATRQHENSREIWGWSGAEQWAQDLKLGCRVLRKSPGFTAVAVLSLALGMGANTTLFSMVYGTLLRPLHYPEQHELLWVTDEFLSMHKSFVPPPTFFAWHAQNRTCSKIAAFMDENLNLTEAGPPLRVPGVKVSIDFLPLLGISPALGRTFSVEEEQRHGPHVVILGHALWTERFGANPKVVGQTVHLDGDNYTVVGVLAPQTEWPVPGPPPQLLLPLQMAPDPGPPMGFAYLKVVARRRPSFSLPAVRADFASIEQRVLPTYPSWFSRYTHVMKLTILPLQEAFVGTVRAALLVLLGVVFLVLLIVCANVTHLQLVRALARQQEFSVRAALGAGWSHLTRQLLVENLLLAFVGGLLGLGLARVSLPLVRLLAPASFLPSRTQPLPGPVLVFSFVVMLSFALVTGLAPLLALASPQRWWPQSSPQTTGSRQKLFLSHLLMAGEISLALTLFIGSLLLVKSFVQIMQVPLGFAANQLLTAKITLPFPRDYSDPGRRARFAEQLVERLRKLPGVQSAAVTSALPFAGVRNRTMLAPAGQRAAEQDATAMIAFSAVTPEYFRTMQIALVAGRGFTERDAASAPPVVVVNETLVQRFFAGEVSPVGKGLNLEVGKPNPQVLTIVGVVRNFQYQLPAETPAPEIFVPWAQRPDINAILVLRTGPAPLSVGGLLQQQVSTFAPSQPVYDLMLMRDRIALASQKERFQAFGVTAFAALALMLAAIGIYGVISYAVTQRSREMGIRLALGAHPYQIVQLVMGRTLQWALGGLLIGVALSLALSRYLRALLWHVKPQDPFILLGAVLFLSALVVIAGTSPALRAARTQPLRVLREL